MSVLNIKKIEFTVSVKNKTENKLDIYTSAFFDFMLSHSFSENIETKWYRTGRYENNTFDIGVTKYLSRTSCYYYTAKVLRNYTGKTYNTISGADYHDGAHNGVCSSESLINGKFNECKKHHVYRNGDSRRYNSAYAFTGTGERNKIYSYSKRGGNRREFCSCVFGRKYSRT